MMQSLSLWNSRAIAPLVALMLVLLAASCGNQTQQASPEQKGPPGQKKRLGEDTPVVVSDGSFRIQSSVSFWEYDEPNDPSNAMLHPDKGLAIKNFAVVRHGRSDCATGLTAVTENGKPVACVGPGYTRCRNCSFEVDYGGNSFKLRIVLRRSGYGLALHGANPQSTFDRFNDDDEYMLKLPGNDVISRIIVKDGGAYSNRDLCGPPAYRTFAATAADDYLTLANHGFTNDAVVRVRSAGAGLMAKNYLVTNVQTDKFKLKDPDSGADVDITANANVDLDGRCELRLIK